MKKKILGIALSLALLSSLFVFAAPVGAGSENAADPAEKTDFYLSLLGPTGVTVIQSEWINDHINKVEYILEYVILDSTFGTGEFTLLYQANSNYLIGKRVNQSLAECVFKDGGTVIGTLTYNRVGKADWNGSAWVYRVVYVNVIDATGVAENFHFSDSQLGASTGLLEAFGAHWAPKQ